MTEQDTQRDEPELQGAQAESEGELGEADLPQAEIVEEAPLDEDPQDMDPLATAERERDEYLEKWRRAQADYANLRRRTLSDVTLAVQRGTGDILTEALGVLEFLDMALKSPCESADAKALLMGVQMTRDQLWKVLEAKGVAMIATQGEFDPEVHQAVATIEGDEPGRIIDVIRAGYRRPGDVLRHAQVRVAVAPTPEASLEADSAESTSED